MSTDVPPTIPVPHPAPIRFGPGGSTIPDVSIVRTDTGEKSVLPDPGECQVGTVGVEVAREVINKARGGVDE